MNTVAEFIEKAKYDLSNLYDGPELQQIIFLLLEEVKGYSRADLKLKGDDRFDEIAKERLDGFLQQLITGKPLQYVLGYAWFCGLKLKVNEDVLIPRPETEELVEWLLTQVSGLKTPGFILDIGTGSGCIAIALKKANPLWMIQAMDFSEGALKVASENAKMNETDVMFSQGDILSAAFCNAVEDKFDLIVSNPPYVLKSEMNSMTEQVRKFEPHQALFVEDHDPLLFYNAIADFSKNHLKEGGMLFFEINSSMGKEVEKMLGEKGFENVELKKDISGNHRMVRAFPPPNPLIT